MRFEFGEVMNIPLRAMRKAGSFVTAQLGNETALKNAQQAKDAHKLGRSFVEMQLLQIRERNPAAVVDVDESLVIDLRDGQAVELREAASYLPGHQPYQEAE